jgi:hypothetical protein
MARKTRKQKVDENILKELITDPLTKKLVEDANFDLQNLLGYKFWIIDDETGFTVATEFNQFLCSDIQEENENERETKITEGTSEGDCGEECSMGEDCSLNGRGCDIHSDPETDTGKD